MISLIPSPSLPSHLAKGQPDAQCRDNARSKAYFYFMCSPNFHVRRGIGEGGYSMKISEDVRQYAAEQGIAAEKALAKGMEEKSKEFVERGAEVYMPA